MFHLPRSLVTAAVAVLFTVTAPTTAAVAGERHAVQLAGASAPVRAEFGQPVRTATERARRKPARAKRAIVGGEVIGIRDAPWQVFIRGINWSCGGSILGPNTVLTAAHCVDDVQPANVGKPFASGGVEIRAGQSLAESAKPGDAPQLRTISALRIHPNWPKTATTLGDVAVLQFAQPLILDNVTAQAVSLPAPGQVPVGDALVGTPLVATGFGVNASGFLGTADGQLRRIRPSIADPDFCGLAENAVSVCGRTPTGTTCQGDSGGPIVLPPAAPGVPPVQVGIVSNGPSGCLPDTRDNYASLWAPEVRAFIDGTPITTAPRLGPLDPVITLPLDVAEGQSVSCAPADFVGAATVETKLSTDDGVVVASAVGGPVSFVLTSAQVGRTLRCRSYGSNAGGVAVSYLALSYRTVVAKPAAPPVFVPPVRTDGACSARSGVKITISHPKRVRRGSKMILTASIRDSDEDATGGTATFKVQDRGRYRAFAVAKVKRSGSRATARIVHRVKRPGAYRFKVEMETLVNGKRCERGTSRAFSVRFVR